MTDDLNLGNHIEACEATPEIESFQQPTQTEVYARSFGFTGKWLMKRLIHWSWSMRMEAWCSSRTARGPETFSLNGVLVTIKMRVAERSWEK